MRLNPQTYALTTVCFERRRIFQRAANAELMLATILRYRDAGRFLLHGFVVMPDHAHILLSPMDSIEKTAQLIKGGFSFAVRKQFTGEVWQPGYFAHRTTSDEDFDAQLAYISANLIRKRYTGYPYVHTSGAWALDRDRVPRAEAPFRRGLECLG